MQEKPKLASFKETHNLEKRIQMFKSSRQGNKQNIFIVVQRDPKCKAFPETKYLKFSIAPSSKIMEIENAVREKLVSIDKKYKEYPFFMFTNKTMPKKDKSVKDVYESQKDPEDGFMYFKYSDVDPF